MGTDPSADPVAETEDGATTCSPLFFAASGIGAKAINPGGLGAGSQFGKHCFFHFFKTHLTQDASSLVNQQATGALRDGRAFRGNERPGNNRHDSNGSS